MSEVERVRQLTEEVLGRLRGDIAKQERLLKDITLEADSRADKERVEISKALFSLKEKLLRLEQLATKLEPEESPMGTFSTFSGLAHFLTSEEGRRTAGRENALAILSAQKERERLSAPHQYADGSWDLPILNADTIAELTEDEHEEQNAN